MKRTISKILLGLVLVFILGMPGVASAQSTITLFSAGTLSSSMQQAQKWVSQCDQKAQQNRQAYAHKKAAAGSNVLATMDPLDASIYMCIDNLEHAIDALMNLIPTEGNPIVGIITGVIEAMAWNVVIQIISAACAYATSILSTITLFLKSQFNRLCIPLPKIALHMPGPLHLPNAKCHGTNFIGPLLGLVPGNNSYSGAASWQLNGLSSH